MTYAQVKEEGNLRVTLSESATMNHEEIDSMTGAELLKSAGLSTTWATEQMEGLTREWEKALNSCGGFYSTAYMEEKIGKIRQAFADIDEERARLHRITDEGVAQ